MSVKPETRALLLEAFTRLNIPPKGVTLEGSNFLSTTHWEETPLERINLIFSSWNFGAGHLSCSIEVSELVDRVLDVIADPADALATVLDICEYFKCVMFTLLPMTHHNVITRASNRNEKFLATYRTATNFQDFFEQVLLTLHDQREVLEHKLRGTPKRKRGGSDPRLEPEKRNTLHEQYDGVHKLTKKIKRDYNLVLKAFAKKRGARGYTLEMWQTEWSRHCADTYAPELQELLVLFADIDNPSASEVAYAFLAQLMGHSKSYLVTLVTDSRKRAKSADSETGN